MWLFICYFEQSEKSSFFEINKPQSSSRRYPPHDDNPKIRGMKKRVNVKPYNVDVGASLLLSCAERDD